MSDFVSCFRLPLPGLGFWSFSRRPATIGRHGGGLSEDFFDIAQQFRLRFQLGLKATREVRDTVGPEKAEPLGELAQSRVGVAAAQPSCDRPCPVGVVALT